MPDSDGAPERESAADTAPDPKEKSDGRKSVGALLSRSGIVVFIALIIELAAGVYLDIVMQIGPSVSVATVLAIPSLALSLGLVALVNRFRRKDGLKR